MTRGKDMNKIQNMQIVPNLEIENLKIRYTGEESDAVSSFSLKICRGESIGIIGESGSGKTSVLHAIMGMIKGEISGSIKYEGRELTRLPERDYNKLRWKDIGIVFQNSHKNLNPRLTVYEHIAESIRKDLYSLHSR